ncbi:YggS family pyridoxal phosphate-dependent enzyme [Corynebacterium poyangense]|uniref:Pyridoxal phosphate homeostasis protein n=1 Tax=Corynebacterium poyangense TaxID=2684405 RepID=A0A7H0SPT0_9CORY|nr:YggS family pyridoxal phosphate-dependent enzyme [Corynebacterium poyangense]MBZ8178142.1 YggS family pyridoxal phosphate-dependent enzyme [Corynebacterium poyangense]QNQ90555.1 YggS family pyridoxal phosphate-dependent enzyme [Corynebacterium poyangense]
MSRYEEIEQGLRAVQAQIARACQQAGRDIDSVTLLPVTKFHPVSDIAILQQLGITEVGENREQEARKKASELPSLRFSMIGHIQSKKCNAVARWADSVHSLDSLKLVEGLDRGVQRAIDAGERSENHTELNCFVQWSADGDTSRGGAPTTDLRYLAEAIMQTSHLKLSGLMVVPPREVPARSVFDQAQQLRMELAEEFHQDLQLSAGMSADLDDAIAAGSNIVRVGTAILGQRPLA